LWRSELAHRLYETMTDPDEQILFFHTLTAHELTEAELRVMFQRWAAGRLPRESLIGFLFRVGWLVPDAWSRVFGGSFEADDNLPRVPLLSHTAVDGMKRATASRLGFWSESVAIVKSLVGSPRPQGPLEPTTL
jgi:hypothetical protein